MLTCGLVRWERLEMCNMAEASEITKNVWQGPTPDVNEHPLEDLGFDVFIETHDVANIPNNQYLSGVSRKMDDGPQRLEFPSSGSLLASFNQIVAIDLINLIDTCRWIYHVTNPEHIEQPVDADGDIPMVELTPRPRKVLIHCGDGYTESSLLAIAYFMFAEGVPLDEAWLRLHCEKKRNFFAYPSDVAFLAVVQQKLLSESPAARNRSIPKSLEPDWLLKMDGSLPSRILPYMYLGNLTHANNPELLRNLGIRRILSIGESVSWRPSETGKWDPENLMMINEVQDNGIDPLTQQFDRCLQFIGKSC